MFVDLNVPWNDATRSSLGPLLGTYERLGYDAVALNHTCAGRMPKVPCPIPKVEYDSKARPLRQYTRLTLILDNPQQNYGINNANEIIRSYDLVAIRPTNEKMFQNVVNSLSDCCDIISVDISAGRLPFTLKHGLVRQALDRGISFELCYGNALASAEGRRAVISNARMISRVTGGKGTILTCAGEDPWLVRAPQDVRALGELFGVTKGDQVAISRRCISHAGTRKHTHGAAVMLVPAAGARMSDFTEDFIRL